MAELEFDPMKDQPPTEGAPKSVRGLLLAAGAITAVVILGLWWFLRPARPTDLRAAKVSEAAPAPPLEPQPASPSPQAVPESADIPDLEESDAFVRSLIAELFGSAELDGWLASGDELVHRGVRALLAISQQRSARKFLDFLPLEGPFSVQARGGALVIAPESYRRYDRFVDLFVALDSARLLRMLERIGPLLTRSVDENAFPGTGFDSILRAAIDHLLSTPVAAGEPEVLRGEDGTYRFADPDLEALSPPRKQLLRLGPGHGDRLRAKLREIRLALGADPASG